MIYFWLNQLKIGHCRELLIAISVLVGASSCSYLVLILILLRVSLLCPVPQHLYGFLFGWVK